MKILCKRTSLSEHVPCGIWLLKIFRLTTFQSYNFWESFSLCHSTMQDSFHTCRYFTRSLAQRFIKPTYDTKFPSSKNKTDILLKFDMFRSHENRTIGDNHYLEFLKHVYAHFLLNFGTHISNEVISFHQIQTIVVLCSRGEKRSRDPNSTKSWI